MKLALLVTGFLGSGKTTFILKSLVDRHRDKKLGVIVNDFGEIGYDKLLYYKEKLRVQGIDGRCVCCEGGGAILQALHRMQDTDLLIVETSGISDPYPVMQALETTGWMSHITVCVVPADSWQDFRREDIFRAQLEYADCVVVSRCDLLPAGIPKELIETLKDKPYFLSYEGKVQEDFYMFLYADHGRVGRFKLLNPEHKRFFQHTIKLNGYLSMYGFENFLRRLPKNVVRVKGVLYCVESPVPMGINWTPRHICWEPVETSTEAFLNFIYYDYFEIPNIPTCSELDPWQAIPVGDFDRREGIAYVEGKPTSEIYAIEYMLQQSLKDFVLVTFPQNPSHKLILKKIYIEPTPQNISYISCNLIENYSKLILWLIPDAFASCIINKARGNKIIHIGKNYLLPKAFISLRADTQEKLKALEKVLNDAVFNESLNILHSASINHLHNLIPDDYH